MIDTPAPRPLPDVHLKHSGGQNRAALLLVKGRFDTTTYPHGRSLQWVVRRTLECSSDCSACAGPSG
jgi:hypothetical protein